MSDIPQRLTAGLADRYVLEREIGAGGMATVYLARDLRHKRSVAVKVVRPELGGPEGVERFLREIELAARLQHPHNCLRKSTTFRPVHLQAFSFQACRRDSSWPSQKP